MSSLTISPTYTGGFSQGIADATNAGHDELILQPGKYTGDTVTSSDGTRGPGRTITRLTIRPEGDRDSVVLGSVTVNQAHYLRFLNLTIGGAIKTPAERTLPIYDGAGGTAPYAGRCQNSGIKLTPVVTDLPVPRLRAMFLNQANQAEALVVTVAPGTRDITVAGLATDASRRTTTTANSIITAINASPAASALVTAAVKAGQDGTGIVSSGFPYFQVMIQGSSGNFTIGSDTRNIEIIGCEFLGGNHVVINLGAKNTKIKHCKWTEASFAINFSVNSSDRFIQNTRICHNDIYGGYNIDCSAMRPSRYDTLYVEDNVMDGTVDPPESTEHVDSWQPIATCRNLFFRRNKMLNSQGQMFYQNNDLFYHNYIENNLFTAYSPAAPAALTSRLGGCKTGFFRFNTLDVTGMIWEDGDTQPGEYTQDMVIYNNITNTFAQLPGVIIPHDYNIVETSGTGWVPAVNETAVLPSFVNASRQDGADFRYLDGTQVGVGDGTTSYLGFTSPLTDLKGNARDPDSPDMGCYVSTAAVA
jgi:hypothetical protein